MCVCVRARGEVHLHRFWFFGTQQIHPVLVQASGGNSIFPNFFFSVSVSVSLSLTYSVLGLLKVPARFASLQTRFAHRSGDVVKRVFLLFCELPTSSVSCPRPC